MTIRDAAGAPLADITVQVRASAEAPMLAEGATDAQGQAQFAGLISNQVRVIVAGVLSNGARLVQPGQDTHGIAVLLGPPPT